MADDDSGGDRGATLVWRLRSSQYGCGVSRIADA